MTVMERIPERIAFRTPILALVWAATILATFSVLLLASGAPALWSLRAASTVAFESLFGIGLYLLCFRGKYRTVEAIGFGLALGAVGSGFVNTMTIGSNVHFLAWALPAILGALFISSRWKESTSIPIRSNAWQFAIIPITFVGVVPIAHYWRENPIHFSIWVQPFGDLLGLEATNFTVSQLGMEQVSWIQGQGLSYHWFGSAWMGHLAQVTEAEPFVAATRLILIFALVGCSTLSWSWAARLTSSRMAPPLAALTVVASGLIAVGVDYGYSVVAAQFFATHWFAIVFLFLFSLAVTESLRTPKPLPLFLIVGLAAFAAAGSRITEGMVLCAASGAIALWSLVTRKRRVRTLAVFGITSLGTVIALALTAAGSSPQSDATAFVIQPNVVLSSFLGMIPEPSPVGQALSVIAVLASVGASTAGAIYLFFNSELKMESIFGLGGLIAGLIGVFGLFQIGSSQLSFLWAGVAIALVPATIGLCVASQKICSNSTQNRIRRASIFGVGASVLVAIVVEFVVFNSESLPYSGIIRWLSPLLAWGLCAIVAVFISIRVIGRELERGFLPVTILMLAVVSIVTCLGLSAIKLAKPGPEVDANSSLSIHPLQLEAADWVRTNTPPDSLFATNRLCDVPSESPPDCRSNWFFVSGVGQRKTLVEGQTNGAGLYGKEQSARQQEVLIMVQDSWNFAVVPNLEATCRLQQAGVDFYWLDKTVSGVLPESSGITLKYENELVAVYEMQPGYANRECVVSK